MVGPAGSAGILGLCFALSFLCATALAQPGDRQVVAKFVLAGFVLACLKIWLVQQAPQWRDIPLDAAKFQLHAEALAAHWQGASVNSQRYMLAGLSELRKVDQWSHDAELPYAAVLGTYEWLYAGYLATWAYVAPHWPLWAVYSNAAFAALFPAGAFGIARGLGATATVATLAGAVTLVDPSAAVNAAWLLKDTLASWCMVVAVWAVVATIHKTRVGVVLLLGGVLGLLGVVRFLGLTAVLLAVLLLLPSLLIKKRILTASSLLVASVCGLALFGTLYYMPVSVLPSNLPPVPPVSSPAALRENAPPFLQQTATAVSLIVSGQANTLSAAKDADLSSSTTDEAVIDWYGRVLESPVVAIAMAATRTLFAPYPWVVLTEGLTYRNGIELYFPGVMLWIICLPGIFWAAGQLLRRPSFPVAFVGLVIAACLVAYVVFLGEWSTRQRVFMLPVFFALAGIGWTDLGQRLGHWKARAS